MDDVLTLFAIDGYVIDAVGNQAASSTPREVFAHIRSVGRAEFFGAAQSRLKPELMAEVCRFDYGGEEEADYRGARYAIYRSFSPDDSDRVELYLTVKEGVHAKG